MWARESDCWGRTKFHWFERKASYSPEFFRPLCNENSPVWEGYMDGVMICRRQPRKADRCKRCIAALARREREDAER